ncbi:ABC transporter ATP-binding protein [Staphylococcus agnetis]|uniref:ABC transporter ATP-binding protein n=1 Tax=Staphylococcus agnetis TaxID=985762 RepID=UPI00208E7969|nr:ABC transporter ATP-binding protein [Staphylococcus agnetis]MCO4342243.1 ABC transporter ATP-binding protein [Staphylococcus agnetis]MCO4344628.1 ABC transporter ATP-binding protein [Staphylococcus agnetis]MCO4346956.1 ABC transporter ATP-binding protein [Staphylococcus agnetis]MCO4349395.1 ABC transporter ATP-binding protein [Staphylococcus agnetis]
MSYVIKTNQLFKQYGAQYALHPTDFSLKKGDICALIGKNGAGKSTLIKLMANHIQPSGGTLELFGTLDDSSQELRKRIGFFIDTTVFMRHLTARQNLEYIAMQTGKVDIQHIQSILKQVGLENETKKVKAFSLGMKQRLGIALALLNHPDVLILDEPINGLDVEGIRDFRQFITQLNKELGMTILISSHILSELQQIATQFVFIENGHIIESISKDTLLNKVQKAISLKVDRPSKAVQIIEELDNAIQYKVHEDNTIVIHTAHMDTTQLNALMWDNGIRVAQIQEEVFNLENYFLQGEGGSKYDKLS